MALLYTIDQNMDPSGFHDEFTEAIYHIWRSYSDTVIPYRTSPKQGEAR